MRPTQEEANELLNEAYWMAWRRWIPDEEPDDDDYCSYGEKKKG